jgi:hypothetical protein
MSDKNEMLDSKDPLKTLLQESAMEQAPETLLSQVMQAIETETSTPDTGKPLITTLGWIVIGAGLTALSLLSFLMSEGEKGSEYLAPITRWIENLRLPLGGFANFPDTVWLGALAFGIYGLLQLFLMKRQLDQHRLF